MAKTVDLERSKRLKSAGWKQETFLVYTEKGEVQDIGKTAKEFAERMGRPYLAAPLAGEMIEWLLGEGKCSLAIKSRVSVYRKLESAHFDIDDNLCNALADAVIWVMERKI